MDYDSDLVKKITRSAKNHHIFAGTLGKDDDLDHGTMIPLYFLNKYLKDYKVVRIEYLVYLLLLIIALDNVLKKQWEIRMFY